MVRGKKKQSSKEISGVKSDGFSFLQYINLLWEEKALSYSETLYKIVTHKTTESCQAAIPKGKQERHCQILKLSENSLIRNLKD